ncbi:MAG: hypothetical protein NC906_07940 [Candidatus Omnitrophica bacterium]|nr:hypothetical protein [Candidatus Omnitrophota bacterium]
MKTGFAAVKITPDFPTQLDGAGTGEKRFFQSIIDDIYARVLIIESSEKKVCLISLDVTIVTEEYTQKIREYAEKLGFSKDAVMVHALQNHSAPSLGHFMLDPDFPQLPAELEYVRGGETRTYQFIFEKTCEAIRIANDSLKPVSIGAGSGVYDGLAFNRRAVMKGDKVRMPWFFSSLQYPFGPADIKYIEGPVDPEIGVLCFRALDMKIDSAILHFTCHPVNVFATAYYALSSDWPGAWIEEVEKLFNTDCLVFNGCCGNINPWPAFQPDFYPDHKKMGKNLTEITKEIIVRINFFDSDVLEFMSKKIEIPLRSEPQIIAKAKEYLEKNPVPEILKDNPNNIDPEWFEAASIMSVEYARRRGDLIYEIQVFRIGDIAIVGLPGEMFVEGQLEIKVHSPAQYTFFAHATNQYVGYIPTKKALQRGGHEAKFGYWSKLVPEALDTIVDNTLLMLKELFRQNK